MWGQRIAANPLARNTDLSSLSGWKINSYYAQTGENRKEGTGGKPRGNAGSYIKTLAVLRVL
jgi:hypothetical protein